MTYYTCPDEATKVTTVISPGDAFEGDDVVIECRGDGNPAPEVSRSEHMCKLENVDQEILELAVKQ